MSGKRRVYPGAVEQQGYGSPTQSPVPSATSSSQNNFIQQAPIMNQSQGIQPIAQQEKPRGTPFGSGLQNNPPNYYVPPPPTTAILTETAQAIPPSYGNQPNYPQQTASSSTSETSPSGQAAQGPHAKHRVYFPVDPEEQATQGSEYAQYNQMTNSMQQMNLNQQGWQGGYTQLTGSAQGSYSQGIQGASVPMQPYQPTGTQTTYQPPVGNTTFQPQSTGDGSYSPVSVDPSVQCPPTFLRMTMNCAPSTTALLNKSSIPFGCIIHPMAKSTSKEDRIPVVNFGVSGIIRCRRCRSYINPFVSFVENGRRWRCNLCNMNNDVPGEYYCPIDSNGRRTDVNERPELSRGFVEFIAPSEYMVRPPMPATYFFVIDVSYYSITSGMFHTVVESVKRLLNDFPGHPRTRIGFITYDSSVHFYNLKANLSQPQMLVVTDIDDMFLPLPEDLLVNVSESRTVIETLLSKMPNMFQATQNVDTVLGVAIKAAFDVMQNVGGKMILFASHLPGLGAGKLPNREDLKLLGTDKECSLLVPEDPSSNYYKNFALDCSRQQISVDVFVCASNYTDVATIGALPQYTGGELFYYPGFKADKDGEKLFRDLSRDITRETGFEAVIRVRTSKALKVSAHFGNFFIRSTDLLALPNVDADKAFGIQLTLSDSTITTKYVSLQSALLYTTSRGERRIRVFTQCLPVTASLADLFKGADVEAVTALTTKMAIEKALGSRLSDAREALVNKCIDILAVYRTELATQSASSSTQLLLPESLKLFPLYVLALVKNVVLRAGTDIRPDERSAFIMAMRALPIAHGLALIYPRLFRVDTITQEVGVPGPTGALVLPPALNLSSERLDRSGAFLLEDGHSMYLWFGKAASSDFVSQVFGVNSLENVDTTQLKLVLLGNEISKRLIAIVNELRAQRSTFMNLYILREGEPREAKFFSYFVEDRTKSVHSYYEFLVNLHQRIQAKITNR